jgi:peptidylprolyl isomerase
LRALPWAIGAVLLALFTTLAVAATPAPDAADPIVAQRGDITLTASAVRDLVAATEPDERTRLEKDPTALAQFVRNYMLNQVLFAEAKAAKWDERPDIAARAERARQNAITETYLASVSQVEAGYPSEADVESAYESNKQRFMVPRQYHIEQIFVAVPATAGAKAEDDAQKKIADIRQQLAKKGADFAEMARKQSEDRTSAPKGGDLGWVREDQLIPAIKPIVTGLPENAMSDPVRSPDGWHLLKLLGTRPAGPAPLADVHDAIVASLKQERQQQNARAYFSTLLRKDPVQINEIQLSHSLSH